MAISKEIELDNGIIVKYHRIVSLNKVTNSSNIIEVASYTSEKKREEEKEMLKEKKAMDIFINTKFVSKEYEENETIEDAYDYLKTLEMFENAEDA